MNPFDKNSHSGYARLHVIISIVVALIASFFTGGGDEVVALLIILLIYWGLWGGIAWIRNGFKKEADKSTTRQPQVLESPAPAVEVNAIEHGDSSEVEEKSTLEKNTEAYRSSEPENTAHREDRKETESSLDNLKEAEHLSKNSFSLSEWLRWLAIISLVLLSAFSAICVLADFPGFYRFTDYPRLRNGRILGYEDLLSKKWSFYLIIMLISFLISLGMRFVYRRLSKFPRSLTGQILGIIAAIISMLGTLPIFFCGMQALSELVEEHSQSHMTRLWVLLFASIGLTYYRWKNVTILLKATARTKPV